MSCDTDQNWDAMIQNKVKLIIWDLDETFWRGTLTEEGVSPIHENVDKVIELSKRGILNSICSKNDPEAARAKLVDMGIWDYFVFPVISFNPKGKAVAQMIEDAALRPENVLFIDDNVSNLEEVKFFNPSIMTAHPDDVLGVLLGHPHCAGKPDPQLTRLNQYRFLEKKTKERNASALSNEEFLRASDIRVSIDYNVEENFDRIVELINRTNQLNYTKKRLEDPEQIEEFQTCMDKSFGYHAGCVHVADNYGDYGLVGFFLMRRRAGKKQLIHFVFSCRTMHMGIEQHVYEMLGRPDIEIVGPVSYDLEPYARVDWINANRHGTRADSSPGPRKLVLLGGCDLLQMASYCSSDRLEFVNRVENGLKVCYEDVGFIAGNRATIRDSQVLRKLGYWSYHEVERFDEGIAACDLVLFSMWPSMNGAYYVTDDGVDLRFARPKYAKMVRARDPEWFKDHMTPIEFAHEQLITRLQVSFEAVRARITERGRVFLLGVHSTADISGNKEKRRSAFNETCRQYCDRHPEQFYFVDYNSIIQPEDLLSGIHFTRHGYFKLARYILDRMEASGTTINAGAKPASRLAATSAKSGIAAPAPAG